jgi:L-alanine-DL-glutamate epimerase-like enolase superfamily enzyme
MAGCAIRPVACEVYLLPVAFRMPLKFGAQVIRTITCVRVKMTVEDGFGQRAQGWGETPLSAGWAWPEQADFVGRSRAMERFCGVLARAWEGVKEKGHPVTVGERFNREVLPGLCEGFETTLTRGDGSRVKLTQLAGLVCNSAFDIAMHDAFGKLVGRPTFETFGREFMDRDLAGYLEPLKGVSFDGKYPADFFKPFKQKPFVWHLVGGLDPLSTGEVSGEMPEDGHPVALEEWIKRDGLKGLKIKLRGNDVAWDFQRMVAVGKIAQALDVDWLSADFNCCSPSPAVVNETLDRLRDEAPDTYRRLLYVEQPFGYELEEHPIDVLSVAARKPIFLDESAHDWKAVRLGRSLGWTGVALKTCKTLSGALLSLCWARAHGMEIMVQDLTNPMLAIIPHGLLAGHAGTVMGLECNAAQYYPDVSGPEAKVHPGLYQRRGGVIDLGSIQGPGMGYRLEEIGRELPERAF